MVDQLERTTNLLALLLETRFAADARRHRQPTEQPVSRRSCGHAWRVRRDKSLLRDVGVPIETEVLGGTRAGQTAYRVDRDRYELRDLDLTDAERRALQVAVAAARTTEAEFGMFKLGGVADSRPPSPPTFRNSNCCLHCARPSRRERVSTSDITRPIARCSHTHCCCARASGT